MAINLPTLVQRVRVDTSGLSRAEAQAKSFAAAMKASSKDIDSATSKLGKDTEAAAQATERSNAAHRETPGSIGPATDAVRKHGKAQTETATSTNSMGAAARRSGRDHDALGNSVRKSTAEMRKAKTDSKVLGGVFKNLSKVMAPGMIVGIASFISPLLTLVSSLGAGAIAVAGQLGQMASAFAATGVAAVGSLSQVSGVVAALPGIAGALFTGMAAVKASFSGLGAYEKAVSTYGASSKQAQLAFSRLTPEVKNLSKEVGVYTSAFKQMGTITRSITVPGFVAGMQAAAPALGVLKIGARDLAKEIAPLAKSLGQFVGSKGFLSDLSVLATNNARVFGTLGGALVPLAKTFSNIAVSAAPMTLALAGAGRQFARFLALKTDNRAGLTAFFNRAAVQAIALARSIGNVLGVLVRIGSIGASVFFGTKGLAGGILDSTTKLNTWVKSGEGVAKITGYFRRMKPVAENTWGALWNFTKGLMNLAKIGSNVFFGTGGMSGGIADVAKKFNDWTKSPGGIEAITGYFREMKPIASEAMLLVKQVMVDLFGLSHDKSTASMLKMIRTDFLPIVTQMLQKMSTMAPAVLSTLKGVADFAGALDPGVILAVANAFGTMVSNLGTLISLVPGMGTIVSLLLAYLSARKLLGGVLIPLLGLTGGKGVGGVMASLMGSSTTAGSTLRAGGVAAGAALEASAVTAAETLRLGAVGLPAGKVGKPTGFGAPAIVTKGAGAAGTAEKAATGAAAATGLRGLFSGGLKGALMGGARIAMKGAIWAMVADLVGETFVNLGVKPSTEKATAGATSVDAATATFNASKKTPDDIAAYNKALTDGEAAIRGLNDSWGGNAAKGITDAVIGVGNMLGLTHNKKTLSQAQQELVDAIDAEKRRVQGLAAKTPRPGVTPRGGPKPTVVPARPPQSQKSANRFGAITESFGANVRTTPGAPTNPVKAPPKKPPLTASQAPDLFAGGKAAAQTDAAVKAGLKKAAISAMFGAKDISAAAGRGLAGMPGYGVVATSQLGAATTAGLKAAAIKGAFGGSDISRNVNTGLNGMPGYGVVATASLNQKIIGGLGQAAISAGLGSIPIAQAVQGNLSVIPGYGVATANGLATNMGNGFSRIPGIVASSLHPGNPGSSIPAFGGAAGRGAAAGVRAGMAPIPGTAAAALKPPAVAGSWFNSGKNAGNRWVAGLGYGVQAAAAKAPKGKAAIIANAFGFSAPKQSGGLLTGSSGGPRQDNLIFAGSRGEFVVNAAAYKRHQALINAINAGQLKDGGMIGGRPAPQPISPFMPRPAASTTAPPAPAPRAVEFHIGTVEDGDTLLRRARATDRMMSLAEGGDSVQMRGIGI